MSSFLMKLSADPPPTPHDRDKPSGRGSMAHEGGDVEGGHRGRDGDVHRVVHIGGRRADTAMTCTDSPTASALGVVTGRVDLF